MTKAKEECITQRKLANETQKRIGVIENEHELIVEDLKARLEIKQAERDRAVEELLSAKADLEKALYSRSETSATIAAEGEKLIEELKVEDFLNVLIYIYVQIS